MSEITLPLAATSAEHAPKAAEKKEVIQNAEKKLVLGFLHSINHTGSPQDESYIHSYFIPAHNSSHNTINSKHNQHQYLHLTYLQIGIKESNQIIK